MKKIKKLVLVLTAFFMLLLSVSAPAPAAVSYTYMTQARTLYDLGLYKGVSTTTFDPDLGTALDRQTGVVMLLRIFGLEKKAGALTDAEAASALAVFNDANSIDGWAKKAAAYAVINGLVHGISNDTFGPGVLLSGKMYCTLILRQLGYSANYDSAPAQLAEKGGLTAAEAARFNEKALIKDDLVGISYGSLQARYENGQSVIAKLVEEKVIAETKAAQAGLVESGAASRTGQPTVTGTLKAGDPAPTAFLTVGSAVITEDQANNGSITQALAVVLSNGAFTSYIDGGGVIVNKLPYGLLINVVRESDNRITITFSGSAVAHTNANDVGNASVTVRADRINGAFADITSNTFAFNFND